MKITAIHCIHAAAIVSAAEKALFSAGTIALERKPVLIREIKLVKHLKKNIVDKKGKHQDTPVI